VAFNEPGSLIRAIGAFERHIIRPSSTPQTGHWCSEKAVSERYDFRSVVKHNSKLQIVSTDVQHLPDSLEVAHMHGRTCFDFNTHHRAALILNEDVDLILILIPIVMERIALSTALRKRRPSRRSRASTWRMGRRTFCKIRRFPRT